MWLHNTQPLMWALPTMPGKTAQLVPASTNWTTKAAQLVEFNKNKAKQGKHLNLDRQGKQSIATPAQQSDEKFWLVQYTMHLASANPSLA